jgi:hypothetical protein
MNWVKATTQGIVSIVDVSKNPGDFLYAKLAHEIGGSLVERVSPMGLKKPYCMFVDEEGLLKENPVVNPLASYLYGSHIHGHPIVGDVLFGKNIMTDDGPDVGGLTEIEAMKVKTTMERHIAKLTGTLVSAE